jgi:hypothetical protein
VQDEPCLTGAEVELAGAKAKINQALKTITALDCQVIIPCTS